MTQRIREKRSVVMSYHFRALAIGDTLILTLGDTQRLILSRFPDAFKLHGNFLCKEYNYLIYVFFGISVWNVVIVSIDRLIAVCFPLRAAIWCTLTKARALYAFNVIFHLLFNMVKLWKYYKPDDTNLHSEACVNPSEFPPWFEDFILLFYFALVNYGCPIIVLLLNVFVLVRFRRQGKDMASMDERGSTKKKETQERNLTLMMLVVAFSFIFISIIFPLEDFVWNYLLAATAEIYPRIRELSFYIAYYFTSLNSCLNFYIYFTVSEPFRKDVIRLLNFNKVK
jgi:preprotein translocase subunit SecG